MSAGRMVLSFLMHLSLLSHLLPATARLVNTTVDDADPAILYSPAGAWAARTQDCTDGCTAKPDVNQVYNHSWHDATYDRFFPTQSDPQSFSFRFNGTALYIYGILSTLADQTSNILMYLDGPNPVGQFIFNGSEPEGSGSFTYNALLYSNTSLPLGEHSFQLQNGEGNNLGPSSLVLFDYLIYTTNVEDPTTSSSVTPPTTSASSTTISSATPTSTSSMLPMPSSVATTAVTSGGPSSSLVKVLPAVVAVVVVAAVLFCIWWWKRQKKREISALEAGQARPDPFPIPSMFIPGQALSVGGGTGHISRTQTPSNDSCVDSTDSRGSKRAQLLFSPPIPFEALPVYDGGQAARLHGSASRSTRSTIVRSAGPGSSLVGVLPPEYRSTFGGD